MLAIENLEQKLATISSDLDAEQQGQVDGDLKALNVDYNALCGSVKAYERDLEKAVAERQNFQGKLDEIRRKLQSLSAQCRDHEYLPLSSGAVDKLTDKFKVDFRI